MRDKTVEDAMTPLESVYMLNITSVIDKDVMNEVGSVSASPLQTLDTLIPPSQLLHRGHSRVPVYKGSRDNVVGMLLVKRLIKLDPRDCVSVCTLEGSQIPPPSCLTTLPLYDLLNVFQTGKSQ